MTESLLLIRLTVLDREIVQANSEEHSDLFKALKGGSSNFGIVTRFDFQAFEAGEIYGGLVTHPNSLTTQVITALTRFVDNIENYPGGSALAFWAWIKGADDSVIISVLHDTTGTVDAPEYSDYTVMEPKISSTMRASSHLNMAKELEFAKGLR